MPGEISDLIHNPSWPVPALYTIKNNHLVALDDRNNWLYVTNTLLDYFPFLNHSYLFNTAVRCIANIPFFSRKPALPEKDMMDWAVQKMNLEVDEIHTLAKTNHFQLIIVFLPFLENFTQTYPNTMEAIAVGEFKRSLTQKGIPVIDVKEEIDKRIASSSAASNGTPITPASLFFKTDIHPNQAGIDLFARIVEDGIKTNIAAKN